jgi:CubicO group peptidase (beta-lactamase class C family)
MYGNSLDWAGLLVMRVNSMSLEAYMQKYLWGPLSIQDITFHNKAKPDVRKKLVHMTKRGNGSVYGASVPLDEKVNWADESYHDGEDPDEFGGGGAFGSAVEYMKILHSICSDDGKLLKSETIDEMFSPQLNSNAQNVLAQFRKIFTGSGNLELGAQVDYGLGGLLISKDEGTDGIGGILRWSGRPNLYWMIDRARGISIFYASNIVPFGDAQSRKMQQLFEKEMYARISKM